MLAAVIFISVGWFGSAFGSSDSLFQDLYARDSEPLPGPIAWGHKYMGGGAGEGDQMLEDGEYQHRQEVKTDAVLPAYCDPPNPCPPGHTSSDGCLEDFENTAEFSRDWQGRQECLCDEEHMFSCPPKGRPQVSQNDISEDALAFQDALEEMLSKSDIDPHKQLVAKKFHEKRGGAGPR